MSKDLKNHYRTSYEQIKLLPWRPDMTIPIYQINRNFEMRMANGEYRDVTLDDVLMEADENKKDR
jgi:hypothetical protein